MIERREAMVLAGLAILAVAVPPAAAASLSDWLEGADIVARFVAAGIPVRSYNIPSSAMMPTLVVGDVFLADLRDAGKMPRRGDVIVFSLPRDPSIIFVKRVAGLPGERIQMTSGRLSINGRQVKRHEIEPYRYTDPFGQNQVMHQYIEALPAADGGPPVQHGILERSDKEALDDTPEYAVPVGNCFTIGDNRDNSNDSRSDVGYVPIRNIIGRAVYRLRPRSGWLVPRGTVPGLD